MIFLTILLLFLISPSTTTSTTSTTYQFNPNKNLNADKHFINQLIQKYGSAFMDSSYEYAHQLALLYQEQKSIPSKESKRLSYYNPEENILVVFQSFLVTVDSELVPIYRIIKNNNGVVVVYGYPPKLYGSDENAPVLLVLDGTNDKRENPGAYYYGKSTDRLEYQRDTIKKLLPQTTTNEIVVPLRALYHDYSSSSSSELISAVVNVEYEVGFYGFPSFFDENLKSVDDDIKSPGLVHWFQLERDGIEGEVGDARTIHSIDENKKKYVPVLGSIKEVVEEEVTVAATTTTSSSKKKKKSKSKANKKQQQQQQQIVTDLEFPSSEDEKEVNTNDNQKSEFPSIEDCLSVPGCKELLQKAQEWERLYWDTLPHSFQKIHEELLNVFKYYDLHHFAAAEHESYQMVKAALERVESGLEHSKHPRKKKPSYSPAIVDESELEELMGTVRVYSMKLKKNFAVYKRIAKREYERMDQLLQRMDKEFIISDSAEKDATITRIYEVLDAMQYQFSFLRTFYKVLATRSEGSSSSSYSNGALFAEDFTKDFRFEELKQADGKKDVLFVRLIVNPLPFALKMKRLQSSSIDSNKKIGNDNHEGFLESGLDLLEGPLEIFKTPQVRRDLKMALEVCKNVHYEDDADMKLLLCVEYIKLNFEVVLLQPIVQDYMIEVSKILKLMRASMDRTPEMFSRVYKSSKQYALNFQKDTKKMTTLKYYQTILDRIKRIERLQKMYGPGVLQKQTFKFNVKDAIEGGLLVCQNSKMALTFVKTILEREEQEHQLSEQEIENGFMLKLSMRLKQHEQEYETMAEKLKILYSD